MLFGFGELWRWRLARVAIWSTISHTVIFFGGKEVTSSRDSGLHPEPVELMRCRVKINRLHAGVGIASSYFLKRCQRSESADWCSLAADVCSVTKLEQQPANAAAAAAAVMSVTLLELQWARGAQRKPDRRKVMTQIPLGCVGRPAVEAPEERTPLHFSLHLMESLEFSFLLAEPPEDESTTTTHLKTLRVDTQPCGWDEQLSKAPV